MSQRLFRFAFAGMMLGMALAAGWWAQAQNPPSPVLLDSTGGTNGVGEVAITGCPLQHTHNAPGSANIRVLGTSRGGVNAAPVQEGHVTISGNVLSDTRINRSRCPFSMRQSRCRCSPEVLTATLAL